MLADFIHPMNAMDNLLAWVWLLAFAYIAVIYTQQGKTADKLWKVCAHATLWIAVYFLLKTCLTYQAA
jgi:hypothetical protein